jgi:hypothetical protein
MQTFRIVAVIVAATNLVACSSSSNSGPTPPTKPVALTISASPPQTQTVQIPQQSGPVTGTVIFPPVTTVPANTSGNLDISILSGTAVAFQRTAPQEAQSFVRQKSSEATLPGGPYIFEMTVTASFGFTLASVPAFNLNLGTAGVANALYVLVVEGGAAAPYQFPITAQGDDLVFPGSAPSLTVAAGAVLTFGIALASNVASAPSIMSFTATPTSLPIGGAGVTLAWNVSGATALSIDNGVGSVSPLTTGTVMPTISVTTPFTMTATNGNGLSVATASVCVASGPVTAAITSPTSYTQCTDPFLTTIVMTNGSCQVVTVTVIGFASVPTVSCGFADASAYTSANADLPFSVDAGATEPVFVLTNGNIGCCVTQPCSVDCSDTLQWTLTTNVGPISADSVPFTINVSNCDLMICQ